MAKIEVQFILEMLGKPKEHLQEALADIVNKVGNEKGIKITEKTLHEPVLLANSKDLYTAFAEITAELESIRHYFGIIFSYFPSNISIISPEELVIKNSFLNEIGGILVQRLHDYDSVAKSLLSEREILTNRLKEAAPHLFKPDVQNIPQQKAQPKGKKKSKKKKVKK